MGTRADFYVGRGKHAEWIGSIAYDGNDIDEKLLRSKSEKKYRERVLKFIEKRDDGTLPKDGWPWPWEDSHTTDCVYAFEDGKVYRVEYADNGIQWNDGKHIVFPDMTNKQNVTLGRRSGLLCMGGHIDD